MSHFRMFFCLLPAQYAGGAARMAFILLLVICRFSFTSLAQSSPASGPANRGNAHTGSNTTTVSLVLTPREQPGISYTFPVDTPVSGAVKSKTSVTAPLRSLVPTSDINLQVSTTGATCGSANGSIIAVASGGTPPYAFDKGDGWTYRSGNFPQLTPGTYTITVRDAAGQSTSVTATVGNTYPKVEIRGTSFQRASGCATADASITLQASGGTPPYLFSKDGVNYQASNQFTGLYPGFYDFYVKDANGCVASVNAFNFTGLVNYYCEPTAFAYSTAVCKNEGLINVSGQGPNKPYTYSLDGVAYQASGEFSNLTSGMYPVYLKDASGAVQILVVPIHQSCWIKLNYISVDAACGQNDGTLTVYASNGTAPYSFTLDGVNYQAGNEFTGLAPGTYFVTVRDAGGFTSSLAATVYDRCPTVSVVTASESCTKMDGTINATPSKGTPPYQYSLDGVNFQSSASFTGLAAGSYTVTLRDANWFTSTATAIVRDACIQVSAQVTHARCGLSNGRITVSATNGTAPYQYALDGLNFQVSNVFDQVAPGAYTVTVKDGSGKSGSAPVTVYDTPAPTVSVLAGAASCRGGDGSANISGTGGVLPFSFSVDGVNFQTGPVFAGLSAGSYTAYIKDGNGCIGSQAFTIGVNCPLLAVSVTEETCGSKNGTIEVSGSGGTPPYQYALDGTSFSGVALFSSLAAGTYTITIKDAKGVTNTASATLKNVCPVVAATVTNGLCTESGGVISAEGSEGYAPYLYSIDGVNFGPDAVFTQLSSGSYTIRVKDSRGLTGATTVQVANFPAPRLQAEALPASCLNNDGQVSVNSLGGTAPFTYSIDGGSFQSSALFTGLSAGTYPVAIKDAYGCSATRDLIVALSNNLTLTTEKELTLCEGRSVRLAVSSNAAWYSWSPAETMDDGSLREPLVSPTQTTLYVVRASIGVCEKEDSVRAVVNPAPVAMAGADTTICFGQTVTLSGSGGTHYEWSPATYLSSEMTATPVSNPSSSVEYFLKVTDDAGCPSLNRASVRITVTPPARLFAGSDTSIVMNEPFQLRARDVNNSGFNQYAWSPPDGLNNPFIEDPVAVLDRDRVYRVTATTAAGCQGSDEITIRVYRGPEIYVPTAFSPNGDGLNDVLKAITVGIKSFHYFAVYNRYGERVFYSTDPAEGWKGSFKGSIQKPDVFVWLAEGVDAKGKEIRRKGSVLLLR